MVRFMFMFMSVDSRSIWISNKQDIINYVINDDFFRHFHCFQANDPTETSDKSF